MRWRRLCRAAGDAFGEESRERRFARVYKQAVSGRLPRHAQNDLRKLSERNAQRGRKVHATVKQKATLVVGHVAPFRRVIFASRLDVNTDSELVRENRAERPLAVGDQFGRPKHTVLVSEILQQTRELDGAS